MSVEASSTSGESVTNVDAESAPLAVELCQLSAKECFVYQVPPLKTASGHRAEEWGLEKPLLTGHLKVFQCDDRLRVVLYRYLDPSSLSSGPDNLAPFAECPIQVRPGDPITPFVDGVIDSSRYFVLRIQDPNRPQRTMMLGIGFRERDTALDFKQTLNDYVRFVDRMAAAAAASLSVGDTASRGGAEAGVDGEVAREGGQSSLPLHTSRDLALKEGQKIHINVKPRAAAHGDDALHSSSQAHQRSQPLGQPRPAASGGGAAFHLRPPPPPGSVVGGAAAARLAPAATAEATVAAATPVPTSVPPADEEEWTDFA